MSFFEYEKSSNVKITKNLLPYGKFVKSLGSGGFGSVSLYESNNYKYAIKSVSYYGNRYEIDHYALNEICILRRLKHKNVLDIVGIVLDETPSISIVTPALSMDLNGFIESVYLGDIIMSEKKYLKYMYDILLGLNYIHSRNIIHKDIKPQNILYDKKNDKMVIGDVGIAIHLECLPQTYKDSTGTIPYLSPELLMLYSNYCYKIDIWSTGILFYELICKEFPFKYSNNIQIYLKEIFKVVGIPNDKTWPGIFNNPIFPYNVNSLKKIKNSKPDFIKIKRNIMNNMQEYGKEIIEIIISMLSANPKSRPNTKEIMSNRIFDSIKNNKEEGVYSYTCLDNLYLRQIGNISYDSNFLSFPKLIRFNIVGWMFNIAGKLGVHVRTLVYSHYLLYRFVEKNLNIASLKLYALSCLNIACSYYEDLSEGPQRYFMEKDVAILVNITNEILRKSRFDLLLASSYDFIEEITTQYYRYETKRIAISGLLIGLLGEINLLYDSSEQALWSIKYACKILKQNFIHESVLRPINISLKQSNKDFIDSLNIKI